MWDFVGSACVSAARQRGRCMQADGCTPYSHIWRDASPGMLLCAPSKHSSSAFISHQPLMLHSDPPSCCIFNGPYNNLLQKQPVIPTKCQLMQGPGCFISLSLPTLLPFLVFILSGRLLMWVCAKSNSFSI